MNQYSRLLTASKLAAALVLAGMLGVGCMPIDLTKTITISTNTQVFKALPGSPIPNDFAPAAIDACKYIPEEYRDVNQIIPNLLAEVGLESLASYVQIEAVDLVKVELVVADGGGSFDGITEITGTMNGEVLVSATPGDGISATSVVLEPESPISVLGVLDSCPTVTGAIRGTVPLDPPTKWDNKITVHVKARVGLM